MPVNVTETAAREIATIITQQELDAEVIRLRVGVKGGGCSGFSYLLDLTESQRDTDEIGSGAKDPQKYDPQTSRETLDHSIMYIFAVALQDGAWHHVKSYLPARAARPAQYLPMAWLIHLWIE